MPGDDRSFTGRFAAYLALNRRRIAIDAILLVSWTLLATEALRLLAAPRWLQFVVIFGGVVVYAQLTPPWQQPPHGED